MTTFEDLGLCDELLDTVEEEGYTEPTPVQAQTIPAALDGRDVLGVAQTGTGKTAASPPWPTLFSPTSPIDYAF